MNLKFLIPFFTVFLMFGFLGTAHSQQQQGLDYKKFGRIAMAVVVEDYPGQKIVEYKYEGREKVSQDKVVDSFRFEVMVNGKEQFVTVKITHDNEAGKDLNITLVEEK